MDIFVSQNPWKRLCRSICTPKSHANSGEAHSTCFPDMQPGQTR